MPNDNEANLNLGFNIDAGQALGDLQQVRGVVAQIRTDTEAIESAMESLGDKTNKLRGYWSDVLTTVQQAQTAVQIMGSIEQANQTTLSSTMQMVNEILQSVKGLGGNIGQAMQIVGYAGGGAGGIGGYGVGASAPTDRFTSDITSSQDFSKQDLSIGIPEVGSGWLKRVGRRRRGAGGEESGGGSYPPPPTPPPPTGGGGDEDESEPVVINATRLGAPQTSVSGTFRKVNPKPAQQELLDQLMERYPKAYQRITDVMTPGREGRAAEYMYGDMMNTINRVSKRLPFGLGSVVKSVMQTKLENEGINPSSIRSAIAQNLEPIAFDDKNNPTAYGRKPGGIPEGGIEDKVGKLADTVANVFGNKLVGSFMSFSGYANIATSVAEGVAAQVRQLTGFAQAQGSVFGAVDYSRSAGLGIDAMARSGFGLNPFFSAQDVMQNQMLGASLGLKGAALNNYVSTGLNFQTQYGVSAQQAQAILGGGLGVGVGINQNAIAYGAVRNIANSTNISTSFADQAYMQSMSNSMAMGATASGSTALGIQATRFPISAQGIQTGAPGLDSNAISFVAQTAKMTGQELMGTTIGTALFAQQQGVGFTQAYGQYASMSPGQQIASIQGLNQRVLQMAGIDPAKIKTIPDLYPYVFKLFIILQNFGFTDIKTQQDAITWAWEVCSKANKTTAMGLQATLPPSLNMNWTAYGSGMEGSRGMGFLLGPIQKQLNSDFTKMQQDYVNNDPNAYAKDKARFNADVSNFNKNNTKIGTLTADFSAGVAPGTASGTNGLQIYISMDPKTAKLLNATVGPSTTGAVPTNAHPKG